MYQVQQDHLIRIVRLTLIPERIGEFMHLFDAVSRQIRSFEGCMHLALLKDAVYPNILTTYSIWTDQEALETYRKSDLFKSTWGKTRKMFAAPPFAFSSYQVKNLG